MNALEHAHAQTIRISLHCSGTSVDLAITDDGRGFNLDTIAGGNHRGIAIMHERIAMVDGTLAIYSAPGQGTTVRGVLPLKESVYGFG